jgi:non-specific serine/threonine protein kinase/serine/threonine-protein kinase
MMALRKEPQRRYASVQHLADDIHRHLAGLPVRAHRDSLGYRVGKFVHRHTAAVLAGVGVAIALVTSSVVSWTFYRQAARERERAELRFSDVRQLARFVLFDFDRVIVTGVTPARKALIEKATEYLGRLEQDGSPDASLEREIVEGYLKVGDLQGNLYGPNLGDREAARASYERALRILDRSRTRNVPLLVRARMKMADLLHQSGSPRAAIEDYTRARKMLESAGLQDAETQRIYVDVLQMQARIHSQIGEYAEALELYEQVLKRGPAKDQGDAGQRLAIAAERRAGEMMARMGRVDEGLPRMLRAVQFYEQRAAAAPGVPAAQRSAATSNALVGDILVLSNRYPDAAVRFRRALEITESLASADPENEQFQRDLSSYLGRLGDAVARSGNLEEARILTRRALDVLRPLLRKNGEIDIYQYAWILLTTPCRDLRDGAKALQHAEHLVNTTKSEDPRTLDLLARAQAATGSLARAVETETRAVKLLPPASDSDMRTELESNLAAFRSGIAYPPDAHESRQAQGRK